MREKIILLASGLFLFACVDNLNSIVEDNPPNLRELNAQEELLIESSNDFAFDLFHEINEIEQDQNFFFSPLSVEYALGMTLNGADKATLEAIKTTLGNETLNELEINEAMHSLTEFLTKIDKTVLLKIANSIWYKENLSIKQAFKEAVETYYDARSEGLDFNDPSAKDIINGWVSDKTEGLIPELIDAIPDNAVMYLINAIYYKAEWQYQFDESLTEAGPFILGNGTTIQTDMMHSEGTRIKYHSTDELHFIDIPYGNGQFSMSAIVPQASISLDEIIPLLNRNNFTSWANAADTARLKLAMPKFKIDYKTLLNDPLTDMGMGIAFIDGADFSRLFEEYESGLQISRVIHQAMIEVNEEGSEAAAATAVEIVETAFPAKPQEIVINRPFVFLIREKHSGTILFAGKLMDPR